jgi:XTP/dITP diphosphohydrolase
MELIIATNNQHKVEEIRSALPPAFSIKSLKEAGINIDIEEPHETLEENAAEKARTIYRLTNTNCFGEDTGLEVYCLGMEPGVRSARYAGDLAGSEENIDKLLQNLTGKTDRKARFRTVICLLLNSKEYYFQGICEGSILSVRKGSAGFGYDAVFQPDTSGKSFGEMDMKEKNLYSHRAKALAGLVAFLKQIR